MSASDPISRLALELARLPGIGRKSAMRLTYFLLRSKDDLPERLAEAIRSARADLLFCGRCGNMAGEDPCPVCRDARRDASTLCVVEQAPDLLAIEATGEYRGLYHVLQGAISPLNGVGPEDLRIRELLLRMGEEEVNEVIVATNPTVDGEATALYLRKILAPSGVRVTRLASGIPVGGDLEYLDRETIGKALAGRRELT